MDFIAISNGNNSMKSEKLTKIKTKRFPFVAVVVDVDYENATGSFPKRFTRVFFSTQFLFSLNKKIVQNK